MKGDLCTLVLCSASSSKLMSGSIAVGQSPLIWEYFVTTVFIGIAAIAVVVFVIALIRKR